MEAFFQNPLSFLSLPSEVIANLKVFITLLGALSLGLVVGYERTYHGRAAGMRTYGLVCMASAALTIISGYIPFWFGGNISHLSAVDPSRTIQGIVTGIGFLGAGIIVKDGHNISGLTTAASVWASSAIGIMMGIGLYLAAILLTFLSVVFMMWGLRIESWLPSRPAVHVFLTFKKGFVPEEDAVRRIAAAHGYEIAQGTFVIYNRSGQTEWNFIAVSFGRKKGAKLVALSKAFRSLDGVEGFQLAHARN